MAIVTVDIDVEGTWMSVQKRLTVGAFFLTAFLTAFLAVVIVGLAQRLDNQRLGIATPLPILAFSPTAFVHLFEWTWNDVALECETFLGPNGYAAVQISPPNEHVVLPEYEFPWWQRYQPVSYRLTSRSGDRTQLVNMIRRCHAAGVQVYADAVINHMAGVDSGIGSAGSSFTKHNYPGIYTAQDFHPCRRGIENYQDRAEVTNCELVGLADLNTGSSHVQQRLADYLKELVSLGIDGFRIDAAKHISATDLQAILKRLTQAIATKPFIYQEVIDPGTEAVKKIEYYDNGNVLEFEYGRRVGEAFAGFEGQHLAQLETLGESWGLMPAAKAVVFIDNHDKQRGHGGGGNYLTYKSGKLYDLANVFMLAHPYGYPQVMSSYTFDSTDQGPPADAQGKTRPVFVNGTSTCFDAWVCEHRRQAIAQMVGFRNAVGTAPLTDWWSDGSNQIAFGRGDRGFVVINRSNAPLTRTFQTQLPPGTYCNVIQSSPLAQGTGCTVPAGAEVGSTASTALVVDQKNQVTLWIAGMDAVALHVGARVGE